MLSLCNLSLHKKTLNRYCRVLLSESFRPKSVACYSSACLESSRELCCPNCSHLTFPSTLWKAAMFSPLFSFLDGYHCQRPQCTLQLPRFVSTYIMQYTVSWSTSELLLQLELYQSEALWCGSHFASKMGDVPT